LTSLPTEGLVIDAPVLHGFLAGASAVRALVHMPAWRKLGPRAWAAFSRHADLGADCSSIRSRPSLARC